MQSIRGTKPKKRPTLYAKKRSVRKHQMGEQVTQEGEAITKKIQLEMKQKGRDNGHDVLCMWSELGMNY